MTEQRRHQQAAHGRFHGKCENKAIYKKTAGQLAATHCRADIGEMRRRLYVVAGNRDKAGLAAVVNRPR